MFPLIRGIGTGIMPNGAIEGNDWSVYRAIFSLHAICKSTAPADRESAPEAGDYLKGLRHASGEA